MNEQEFDIFNITVLLVQIRNWWPGTVDIKLQCDNSEVFQKIIDKFQEGTWHYKKSTYAYKSIRTSPNKPVVDNLIDYINNNIVNKINTHGSRVILKIQLENSASLKKNERNATTEELDKIKDAFKKYLVV